MGVGDDLRNLSFPLQSAHQSIQRLHLPPRWSILFKVANKADADGMKIYIPVAGMVADILQVAGFPNFTIRRNQIVVGNGKT